MKAKLARWGNSLAVRLPADVVREFGLQEGQTVGLRAKKPVLEIETGRPTVNGVPVYPIEELIAEMDRLGPEHRPGVIDFGPDRGAEIIDDEYSRRAADPEGGRPGVGRSPPDRRAGAIRRAPGNRPDRP